MSPSSIGPEGGTGSVTVATQAECTWTATSTASWISGLNPTSGQGGGHVDFQVTANPTPQGRQAEIQLNTSTIQIRQDAAACQFDLTPRSQALPAAGGNVSITVATLAGCAWTATTSDTWLVIAAPAAGNGNGSVNLTAAPNGGASTRTAAIAIGSQSFVVTQAANQPAPPAPVCSSSIVPTGATIAAAGDIVPVTVHATAGCAWSALSHDDWLTVLSGASGTGDGSVTIRVDANTGVAKIGSVTIAGQTLTITQADGTKPPCSYTLQSTAQAATAASGLAGTSVIAQPGCGWTATSNASWLTIASGATGSGNGPVTINVAANSGASRSGTVTIAGLAFTVNQAGTCALTIDPASLSLSASATTGNTIGVTTGAGCTWATTSNDTWLTITAGATGGNGNGSVVFSAAANSGASRTGTLTIGGQTFTANQAGTCALTINPTSQSLAATASTGNTVAVTTAQGCTWSATSNVTWLTITSGATGGNGNGSVVFSAAANSGAPRTGLLTIGGQTFTVNQAGTCALTINPTSQSLASTASTGNTVAVATAQGCTWSATSNDTWLTITSGATGGNGNGSVVFSAAANNGAPRTGTLTIGGQTFTANQASGCSFTLNPTGASVVVGATTGNTVAIGAGSGCGWSATSGASWLTITAGSSGTGPGTTTYSVAGNTGAARSGKLTIAGIDFTVNQSGCSFSLNPTGASVAATASTGNTVSISTTPTCQWTSTSNATWLTITAGAGGTGGGTTTYSASANTSNARSGTLTIAGVTFTVNQASGCNYTLNPMNASFNRNAQTNRTFSVSTTATCSWTATTTDSWIIITTGSGTGNGTVHYDLAANNTGDSRTGTIVVSGVPFTINQGK